MKAASPALIALLNSGADFQMVDLWTITLVGGAVLRWSGGDVPIVSGGHTYALGPMIWGELGLHKEDFAQIEQAMVVENNPEKAKSFVTEEMLAVGVVGGPVDLIRRIEKLAGLGLQHISLGPPLGPDLLAAVEVIGREVIPYFR